MGLLNRVLRVAGTVARDLAQPRGRARERPEARPRGGRRGRATRTDGVHEGDRGPLPHTVTEYDVARHGLPPLAYAPSADGDADPGEVVWAWVPYDENDGRGKDRPVLVVARHRGGLLGLQLTSKDHDRDAAQEARWGRHWIDVGSGGWDPRGRPSEARLDRVLHLPAGSVRREGAALSRAMYERVAVALVAHHGA